MPKTLERRNMNETNKTRFGASVSCTCVDPAYGYGICCIAASPARQPRRGCETIAEQPDLPWFGAKTEAAVRRYQSRNGLAADGIVGAQTRAKLTKEALLLNQILDTARSYLGLAYQSGGTSPQTGFDCSGFTQYVFARAGISIPRVSRDQASAGVAVPYSQLRPGDLVCFNSPVSHVGIYLGGGKFIHSPKPGDRVKITELKYMDLTAIRRFTGVLVG